MIACCHLNISNTASYLCILKARIIIKVFLYYFLFVQITVSSLLSWKDSPCYIAIGFRRFWSWMFHLTHTNHICLQKPIWIQFCILASLVLGLQPNIWWVAVKTSLQAGRLLLPSLGSHAPFKCVQFQIVAWALSGCAEMWAGPDILQLLSLPDKYNQPHSKEWGI